MKCHKEDAPLLGLMGQSMRLIGKRAQELYAEYDLNRAQSGILFALHQAFECNAAVNYIDDQEDGTGRLHYKKSR